VGTKVLSIAFAPSNGHPSTHGPRSASVHPIAANQQWFTFWQHAAWIDAGVIDDDREQTNLDEAIKVAEALELIFQWR
jgi:hypothetical protein